ncbi:MAG TPA: hypothetical protein VE553_02570, partial [Candidatus Binatia bacterium]|nr:hypothetical protein [Candidatus Binatia bacterium]
MSLMQIAATVRDRRSDSPWLQVLMPVVAVGGASLMALLVAEGFWPVALMLLLALPGFVLLHRYPFAVLMIWLLLAPFLVATGGGILRYVYWIIHRALPPAAIMIVVLSAALRIHPRRLPRPSVADAAALAYVAASLLSILYLSEQVSTTAIYLYDHVFIPVCLYLLVRLVRPQERDLRLLLPVVIFTLVTQSIIGLLSWSAPQLLPGAWLGRAGLRTTGSLDSYSVFTATVAFCGLYLFEYAESLQSNRKARYALVFLFLLSCFMIFFSFSRG